MRLLGARWQLGDVEDVEGLAVTILRRTGLADDEDAIAYLFEVVWRAWGRWDPSRGSFSTFCFRTCQGGAVDYRRKRDGRTRWAFGGGRFYERELPELVRLDADDSELDRVGGALSGSGLDDGSRGLPDQLRVLGGRSSQPAWLAKEIRRSRARRAA